MTFEPLSDSWQLSDKGSKVTYAMRALLADGLGTRLGVDTTPCNYSHTHTAHIALLHILHMHTCTYTTHHAHTQHTYIHTHCHMPHTHTVARRVIPLHVNRSGQHPSGQHPVAAERWKAAAVRQKAVTVSMAASTLSGQP